MPINRREFNKQETLRHIRSIFMSLYAQGGINSVSVNILCKECGIARSTFYLYFDDKFAILESIEEDLLNDMRTICHDLRDCDMSDVTSGQPLKKASAAIRYLKENADTYRALLGPYGDHRFSAKWRKDIIDSFADRFLSEKGDPRSADIACTIFSSALIGLYTKLLFDMPNMSEREFAIIMGNLLKYSLYDFQAFAEQSITSAKNLQTVGITTATL